MGTASHRCTPSPRLRRCHAARRIPAKKKSRLTLLEIFASSAISRFPVPGISRKTSRAQNIKLDVQWYAGLAECEHDCRLRAGSDFRKFCFLSLYRDFAFAVENSPELIVPKRVDRK